MKRAWSFGFYFWYFAGVASMSAFAVLYYQSLGFSGAQIGMLSGLSPLLTLACTPLWTGLADASRRPRLVLSLTLIGSGLTALLIPQLRTFWPMLAGCVALSVCVAPISSLADSAAMTLLADDRERYGRLRLGGTLGYAVAAPVAGQLVEHYGLACAFWSFAAMMLLALLTAQKLWPGSAAHWAPAAGPARTSVWAGSRQLMTNPRWLLFLAGVFASGLALAATNTYLFPYLKEAGASEATMGLALSVGVVLEIPVLFFGHRLLQWLKPYRLFVVAVAVSAVRLLAFAAARDATQALLIQALNGLTFPTVWLAAVAYAAENAPPGLSATAQGLLGAVAFGISAAVGGFAGGLLLTAVGAHAMFFIFGVVALILIGLVAAARWALDRREGTPGETRAAPAGRG